MDSYSISAVEQLTGIKAHTLRVWERRYQGMVPHRTDTNIRYYDDDQLRRILNISTLIGHGYKISALSACSDAELGALLTEIFNSSEARAQDVHVNALVNYMLAFDERAFDKVLSGSIVKYGFYEAVTGVMYPFLRKTGMLWSTNNAAPSQEHFASCLIRRKLLSAIDGIPYPKAAKKKCIIFLPPGEWHEIGLLTAEYLIRQRGVETINLGQDVPLDSLEVAVEKTKATHLVTFFTTGGDVPAMLAALSGICAGHGARLLAYAHAEVEKKLPHVTMLPSPESIFDHI